MPAPFFSDLVSAVSDTLDPKIQQFNLWAVQKIADLQTRLVNAFGELETDLGTGAALGTNSVTTAKINAGAVTTAKLAAGAVDTAALADLNVTTAKIAVGAVDSSLLASNSVITAKILDGAVTYAKLAADAKVSSKIFTASTSFVTTGGSDQFLTGPDGAAATSTPILPLIIATGAGTIKNLYVNSFNTPVSGAFTATVKKSTDRGNTWSALGGSSVTCAITNPSYAANDTTHTGTFSSGDYISVCINNTAGSNVTNPVVQFELNYS